MIKSDILNENQLEAVQHGDGPLLVLAGPGSGKTRVLTSRIARIIEATPRKYFKILGLTFTNKAAAEMRERIAALVPHAGERTLLTTFHSFAARLLRQHGHHVGLQPNFTILAQEADRHGLLDEVLDEASIRLADRSTERLLPVITRLIENDIAPDDALQILQCGSYSEPEALAAIYQGYRTRMIERNSLDFVGLMAEALRLLQKHAGVRLQIQRVYPYICVDEFQDTNFSQYEMLAHIVNPKEPNLFVVADDDQLIYQWNGASPERLKKLRTAFDMKLLQLPENYRCPAAVVAYANNLIEYNFDRSPERLALKAHKETRGRSVVHLAGFEDFTQEADWVADQIVDRTAKARAGCVVLARARKLLAQMVEALERHDVAAYIGTRKRLPAMVSFGLEIGQLAKPPGASAPDLQGVLHAGRHRSECQGYRLSCWRRGG